MNLTNLSGLILEYDSGIAPAPYSHVFRLALDWSGKTLQTTLDIRHTNREELTEQEILDEGFSLNDDYSYNGNLNAVWINPLKELYSQTQWEDKSLEGEGVLVIPLEKRKELDIQVPVNQESWLLMAQNLIQAVYETSKKEAPLKISYRLVQGGHTLDCSLTVKFSKRNVVFEKNGEIKNVNWEYAIQLVKMVFTADYHYELARKQPGKNQGAYINCGDGHWHELGKGAINIDPSFDAVSKIRDGFADLISGRDCS